MVEMVVRACPPGFFYVGRERMNIFSGKTISPIREYIAKLIREDKPKRILMPCVGSFAVCFLLSEEERKRTYCSDINLYSSIMGYLADSDCENVVEKLGLKLSHMPEDVSEMDILAEAMYRMSLEQIGTNNEYGLNKRKSMEMEHDDLIEQIKGELVSCKDRLSGIHYDIVDFRAVVDDLQEGDFLYVNPPTYSGGYEKMFPYNDIQWSKPEIAFFDNKEYDAIVQKMFESPATVVVYSQKTVKVPYAKIVYAQYMGGGRTDYILSNKDFAGYAKSENKEKKKVALYPIFNDDEITENSKVQILEVDKDTCLYYRDLFVHKLGTTKAECYYLMLIDGKVTTAFGLHRRDFFSMKSNYIGEVFCISVSSKKYKRLGKLFMMCLTSGSFKKYLQSTMMMGARTLQGIKTSSKTSHHEGKTDRGVMKLIKREEQANGTFLVVYVGDFRDDTYTDCVKKWLKQYGYYKRG